MKVEEVIKAGEEKSIIVPVQNIDKTVSEHSVNCSMHPKHVTSVIQVLE
jgi:hypothetical protein